MAAQGTNRQHLLVALPIPEPTIALGQLRRLFDIDISFVSTNAGPLTNEQWAPVTMLCSLFCFPSEPASQTPRLKYIHLFSSGSDSITDHAVTRIPDVRITTCNGVAPPQIAEWVFMTLLLHNHSYFPLLAQQRQRNWETTRDLTSVRDLTAQRIGILGYGKIGRQVGRLAKAFGMTVLAYTASPRHTPESRRDAGYCVPGTGDDQGICPDEWFSGTSKHDLHHFLDSDLDILVATLPLTSHTRHLLGREEFELLSKRRAFLSNISRGQIVNQNDLITALNEGSLRGAALDVADPEPLPPESLLWSAQNLIMTPHVSALSDKYGQRAFEILGMNVGRYLKRQELVNELNLQKGY